VNGDNLGIGSSVQFLVEAQITGGIVRVTTLPQSTAETIVQLMAPLTWRVRDATKIHVQVFSYYEMISQRYLAYHVGVIVIL